MYAKRAPSYSEVFPQRYSESSALIINLKKFLGSIAKHKGREKGRDNWILFCLMNWQQNY